MLTARLIASLLGSAFINLNITTCQSPGETDKVPESDQVDSGKASLPGVSTDDLSPREESQWSSHVRELLAPCKETPVSIAKCIEEKRDCKACLPAANYLVTQVRQGKTTAQVEVSYKERFSPDSVLNIDIVGSPSKGSPNAAITIVEWADFECPACRAASPTLDEFVKKNEDVQLVFKNFPLGSHEHAEHAARAAMAADRQGKFWQMHKALFDSKMPLTETTILAFAKEMSLDLTKFKKDMRSDEIADAVARDRKQGEDVKLRATPTIFINGRSFSYATDLKVGLREWIELERKIVSSKPAAKESAKPESQAKSPAPAPAVPAPSKAP